MGVFLGVLTPGVPGGGGPGGGRGVVRRLMFSIK